jgi:heme exporter protein C
VPQVTLAQQKIGSVDVIGTASAGNRGAVSEHWLLQHRRPIAAAGLVIVMLVVGLVVAPEDGIQGQPQRLMYLHVPAAWTAFAALLVVSVASAMRLLGGRRRWDAVALACAELGAAMTALTLVEGSIWGHAAWGVWWAWEPRLVTTALLYLLALAYLALRSLPGDADQVVRRAAVAGVGFAVLVPIVHFSVLWWRTLHQPPTLLRPSLDAPIAPLMLLALLLGVAAFSAGGVWYVRARVRQLTATPATPLAEPVATPAPGPADEVVAR